MNRNPYNCRCALAVSSPPVFAHEKFCPAAVRHRVTSLSQSREDVEGFRVSFATLVGPMQGMSSAKPLKTLFGPETLVIENDRVLPTQRDQGSNLQSRRRHAVCLVAVGKHRMEDSPMENVNPVKLR